MWGDQLVTFNYAYRVYDSLGNPVSYEKKVNGSYLEYVFTWEKGRQLASATYGTKSVTYEYDADGLRTQKTVNGVVYDYYWQGGKLYAMTVTNGSTVNTMTFFYSVSGIPTAFTYNDTYYYYVTNLQGDVIGIANNNGVIGTYSYDAWGNIVGTNSAGSAEEQLLNANPLRYRGYIYDTETGFYYLQSRYYDPEVCRFINADESKYLGANGDFQSYNLYAYCSNNPVMYSDPTGEFAILLSALVTSIAIGAIIGAGTSFGVTLYNDYSDDGEIFNSSIGLDEYLGNTLGGFIAGAGIGACTVIGAGLGAAMLAGESLVVAGVTLSGTTALSLSLGTSFVTGGLDYVAKTSINKKETFQISDMLIEAGVNTVSGFVSFVGGFCGSVSGVKIPGVKNGISGFAKYHLGMSWFGGYPTKFLFSKIKKLLQERY